MDGTLPRPATSRWPGWLRATAPYAAVLALNVAFHFPSLLNAGGVSSDAAIVGLQAMHFLDGETSRFLWGAGYQGTVEVWLTAAFFAVGGATPLMLVLVPFVGHLVLSCVVLALLIRVLPSRAAAFVTSLPLVFTPQAINGIVMYPPRQWSITFVMCGAMLVAWPSSRTPARVALGVALAFFAVYLDLFASLWIPAIGLLTLLVCLDPPLERQAVIRRFAGGAAGAVIGVGLVLALRAGAPRSHSFMLDGHFIKKNWPLMRDTSLPWLLGAKVWIPGEHLYPDLWTPPMWVAALQWFGAISVLVLAAVSAVCACTSRVPWAVKRLVAFGVVASATAVGGFLVSNWPADMWTTRYLGPIIWCLPFSLAALACVLRPARLAAALVPYLAVAALGGWLSYGPFVDGVRPRLDARGSMQEEHALGEFLRQRGYEHGYAQYWLAHRLTFLWRERPIVASFEPNRFQPYADAVERAKKRAYIFHPSEPRAQPDMVLTELRNRPGRFEIVQVAGFTVILYDER